MFLIWFPLQEKKKKKEKIKTQILYRLMETKEAYNHINRLYGFVFLFCVSELGKDLTEKENFGSHAYPLGK